MTPTFAERSSRPRRASSVPTAPLPAEARAALAAIVADMSNVPRGIIGDPAEVVHFLGRQARRLMGVRDMRVPVPTLPAPRPPSAVLMAPGAPVRPGTLPSRSRTVVGRRGRPVPVVLRRARAAGQIELPL